MFAMAFNKNQLSDFEFETLTKAGSQWVEKMIMRRVRVQDTPTSLVNDMLDYLDLNSQYCYYIRRENYHMDIYFVDPIDHANFCLMLTARAKKMQLN